MRTGPHYWPVAGRFVVAFLLFIALIGAMIAINIASYAYTRLGLSAPWIFSILIASVLGSWFNIPVARLGGNAVYEPMVVSVYGMLYVVPAWTRAETKIVAVNVGGAVIPTGLTAYLVVHARLGWQAALATALVTVVVHAVARVVPGVGIVVPTLMPAAAAAIVVWIMHAPSAAALAYVCGTMGTLIGADLLNLPRVRDLEAPVVSIGGAGTFDGIFVNGILAVILATL